MHLFLLGDQSYVLSGLLLLGGAVYGEIRAQCLLLDFLLCEIESLGLR